MAYTILAIDDDEQLRVMIEDILVAEGYTVHLAENGREGMRVFAAEPPDLVITDLVMPEGEGLETISAIRQVSTELPILAISGGIPGIATDFLPVAKGLGANDALAKPIRPDALLGKVKALLEKR